MSSREKKKKQKQVVRPMTTSDKPVMLHIIEISRGNGAKQHLISVDHRNFKVYKL